MNRVSNNNHVRVQTNSRSNEFYGACIYALHDLPTPWPLRNIRKKKKYTIHSIGILDFPFSCCCCFSYIRVQRAMKFAHSHERERIGVTLCYM